MDIFDKIQNFIDNNEIEIRIFKNKIYVANYIEITDFTNLKIQIKHKDGIVSITGKELVISKLLNNEILICGEISNIEIR